MKTLTRERASTRPGQAGTRGRAITDDLAAVLAVLQRMQTRVMVADLEFRLVFVNDLAMRTLRGLERELIASFGVSVDQLLDGSIHRFHRDPARIERILRDESALPKPMSFGFGGRVLQGSANSIVVDGRTVGYVVTWEDMTEETATIAAARAETEDARAIQHTMTALAGARTAEDAARAAIDAVRSGFVWAYGSYWKVDPASNTLRFEVESGDASEEFRRVTRTASFAEGVGLSGRAWRARDLVFVGDLAEVTDCVRAPAAQRAGVRSGICFPLQVNGRVIGTMDFFTAETLEPSPERLSTLRLVGQLVSQTMERLIVQGREHERAIAVRGNSQALAAAAEELQVVSVQMGQNSTHTAHEVDQIAAASMQVSQSIDSVSAGAEEMSASIREIARNASEATTVANSAVADADEATQIVSRLGDSSTEIGQIVKVITSIAQQTNLLALNATIEAARAGEAGKGFAVVANEVKELAKATATATEDISRKIESIQSETQRSIDAIGSVTSVIGQIADFQNTIASAVEEQAATTNDMARSVTEASRGAQQISQMLRSVNDAAASTAAGANDSRRAATELAELAAQLHALVEDAT
jgi:methyl-accepting chemotaxis protein